MILTGAIIGGIVGLIAVVFIYFGKEQRFNKVLRSIKDPVEYAALYHYSSATRFRGSLKFFDSYGVLYVVGKMAYYKSKENAAPELSFNLAECTIQQEPDWRMLKWFSITTADGQKYYFDSHKMGAFKNNSDETLKGLAFLQGKKSA